MVAAPYRVKRPSVLWTGCSACRTEKPADDTPASENFSTVSQLTENGAKCYKPPVLRELIWSTRDLFHRVIHIFCGIGVPSSLDSHEKQWRQSLPADGWSSLRFL